MLLRSACLAVSVLLVQSSILWAQDSETPRKSNSQLRRSASQSERPEPKQEKPRSGVSVSASASSSASGFGYGNGMGFGNQPGMQFGNSYGNPMQFNRGGYGNGMGFGNARANASVNVTVNGDEPKSASQPSSSASANKNSATSKSSSSSKKNRTSSYSDDTRSISVVESKNKIKVTIEYPGLEDEKTYSAKNVAELQKKFPEAYEAYKLATEKDDEADDATGASAEAGDKAKSLLEDEISRMEKEHANNPQMLQMLQQMRREVKR